MYNVIHKSDKDPTSEFNNIWLNERTGALYIWSGRPVKIGFAKDSVLLCADVYDLEFRHNPSIMNQKYSYKYEYNKVPLRVIVDIESFDYKGDDLVVRFGNDYGSVKVENGTYILSQKDNVRLNGKMEFLCKPLSGLAEVKIYVISYE